jgi:hypothetical protein
MAEPSRRFSKSFTSIAYSKWGSGVLRTEAEQRGVQGTSVSDLLRGLYQRLGPKEGKSPIFYPRCALMNCDPSSGIEIETAKISFFMLIGSVGSPPANANDNALVRQYLTRVKDNDTEQARATLMNAMDTVSLAAIEVSMISLSADTSVCNRNLGIYPSKIRTLPIDFLPVAIRTMLYPNTFEFGINQNEINELGKAFCQAVHLSNHALVVFISAFQPSTTYNTLSNERKTNYFREFILMVFRMSIDFIRVQIDHPEHIYIEVWKPIDENIDNYVILLIPMISDNITRIKVRAIFYDCMKNEIESSAWIENNNPSMSKHRAYSDIIPCLEKRSRESVNKLQMVAEIPICIYHRLLSANIEHLLTNAGPRGSRKVRSLERFTSAAERRTTLLALIQPGEKLANGPSGFNIVV